MGNPMNTYTHNTHRNAAFTLIEILIVVVILGILAAVVIVQISGMRADAERSAFISSGQIFQEAAYRYFLDNGAFPPDRRSGRLPDGFGDYITSQSWERLTPIDGLWDMEADSYGLTSSLGVHFKSGTGDRKDDAYMQKIDAIIDNGDLATGIFRKLAGRRYYFVIAE